MHVAVSDHHRFTVFGDRQLHPATVEAPHISRAAVAPYKIDASHPGRSIVKNADTNRGAHPNLVENLRSHGEWLTGPR